MKNYIFVSRHTPTIEQSELAAEKGIKLIHVGDVDAFDRNASDVLVKLAFDHSADGAIVVHPALGFHAMSAGLEVGIFENGTRPSEGGKPAFFAKSLQIWSIGSHPNSNGVGFFLDGVARPGTWFGNPSDDDGMNI